MLEFLKTPAGAYNLTFILAIFGWLVSGVGIFAGFHLTKVRGVEAEAKARKTEVQRVETVEELRVAKAEASAAKQKADELESQQRPRLLTSEQAATVRASLIAAFPEGSPAPFVVASKMLDPESERYARQIFEGLPFAEEIKGFSEVGILPFQGIRVFAVGDAAAEPCAKIKAAFHAAMITFTDEPFRPAACPIHPDMGVFVFVGYK